MSDINPTIVTNQLAVTIESGGETVEVLITNPEVVVDFINHAGTTGGGGGDMYKSVYDTNNDGVVNAADTASNVAWGNVSSKPSELTNFLNGGSSSHTTIDSHLSSTSNPHSVTANQVLPSQTGKNKKYLKTDGSNTSWDNSFADIVFEDGVAPATPASSTRIVYSKSNGLFVKDPAGTEIGLSTIPILQKNTTYTLSLSDIDCFHVVTDTADINVPSYLSVQIPIGSLFIVYKTTPNVVKFVPAGGVTITTEIGLTLNATYSVASILKIDTNSWVAFGSLKA